MDTCFDTGVNVAESPDTLLVQQKALIEGRRKVQMFPSFTPELQLPAGLKRYVNQRGTFHFDPSKVSESEIEALSSKGRENELLNLGPHNKYDVALRHLGGDELVYITEYTPAGVEVRSALGTNTTADEQLKYFEATKEPGSKIVVGEAPARILPVIRNS